MILFSPQCVTVGYLFPVEIIAGGQMNNTRREAGLEIEIGGIILRSEIGSGGRGTTTGGGGAVAAGGGVEKGVGINPHLCLGTDHQITVLSGQRHHQCISKLIM